MIRKKENVIINNIEDLRHRVGSEELYYTVYNYFEININSEEGQEIPLSEILDVFNIEHYNQYLTQDQATKLFTEAYKNYITGSDLLTIEFEDNQYPVSKTSLKKWLNQKSITLHTADKTASIKIDGYQE